jgi:SAM-dependent methyltransferase
MPADPSFTDAHGRQLAVVPGFAARIFQRDRAVIASATGYAGIAGQHAGDMAGIRSRVALGTHLIATLASDAPARDVLVIGASDGRECIWLAHEGAERVVGIDIEPSKVISDDAWRGYEACVPGADLARIRPRIDLRRDDICRSALPDASFDRIHSWQTFEHIMDPAAALREIARLLRPGGVASIEYNPFFSIDGAHWAATIDIPWAHARLDREDLRAAVRQLHTDPQDWAADFVHTGINRMCLSDLSEMTAAAGLEMLALLPRLRTEDLLALDQTIVKEVRERFPAAQMIDLGSRIVRVVVRREG